MMSLHSSTFKESFCTMRPHAESFFVCFYQKLFELHPEAKAELNQINFEEQKVFMYSVLLAVEHSQDWSTTSTHLRAVGALFLKPGVPSVLYQWIAEALLATLEYSYATEWSKELEEAWLAVYVLVVGELQMGFKEKQIILPKGLNGNLVPRHTTKQVRSTTPSIRTQFISALGIAMIMNLEISAPALAAQYIAKKGDTLSHNVAGLLIPGPVWGKKGSLAKVIALNPELKNQDHLEPGTIIELGDLPSKQFCSSEKSAAVLPSDKVTEILEKIGVTDDEKKAAKNRSPASEDKDEELPIKFKARFLAHPGYLSTSQIVSGVQDSIKVSGYSFQDVEGGLRVILPEQVFMDLAISQRSFSLSGQSAAVYQFNQSTTRFAEIQALGGACTDSNSSAHQWCVAAGFTVDSMPILTFVDNTTFKMTRAEDQFATLKLEYEKTRKSRSSWKLTGTYFYGLKRGQNEPIVWNQNQMFQTSFDVKIPRTDKLSFIIGTGFDYQWMSLKLNQDQFNANALHFKTNLGVELEF